ncbi:Lipopolysaccharide export system protein LptC [bacterium HR07]|nr:Lipopolysaccharide export system protein LptC [bacterium HR07]
MITGALFYWLWSATPRLWPEPSGISAPAISAEHAQIMKYDAAGKKLWELEARAMHTTESESIAEEVSLRFFDGAGREILHVRAPRARLNNRTEDLELVGSVRAQGSEFSFTAEDLFWDSQSKVLSTASRVRIEREDFTLTGRGLEYSAETGLVTIVSEARLIVRPKKSPK